MTVEVLSPCVIDFQNPEEWLKEKSNLLSDLNAYKRIHLYESDTKSSQIMSRGFQPLMASHPGKFIF